MEYSHVDPPSAEVFHANYAPVCKRGKPFKVDSEGGFDMVLLGRRCEDGFCPPGSSCHQLEHFAHCCR